MNWKEFFKLTWAKFILFLLIPIFYSQFGSINCLEAPCPQPYFFIPFIFTIFSYIPYYYQENIIQNIILGVIGSYVLTSLIIFFYANLNIKLRNSIKLNIWKVLLTILILIIIFKINFTRIQVFEFCKNCSPNIYESLFTYRWINPIMLIETLIILSYLISCSIIYAFKNKKNNQPK